MKFTETNISGVIVIEPKIYGDDRGFFMETWHRQKFRDNGIDTDFVQDNHSRSVRNTLRGLHYQFPQAQGKLVRVTAGEVYDVAVDLRRGSGSFGRGFGLALSADNRKMLWIPPGFAHGFLVTSDDAEVVYKCTDYYAPGYDHTLRWDDPALAISWPLPAGVRPLLSAKDRDGSELNAAVIFD